MSVTDRIGRVKKGERCIALDENAKRCRRPATKAVYYHGNPEHFYGVGDENVAQWVRAAFCDRHEP